jgi:hypothetical protein
MRGPGRAVGLMLIALLGVSCRTVAQIGEQPSATRDPAGRAGAYELDSDLCCQEVQGTDEQSIAEAHAARMRRRGWDAP